ncbi:MAG: zinc ribbon domain-containing protein, partial [Acidobacteria bacterium]|nr:zinc ribbon domain-containing protein [Acidobacteriota bacterium]
MFCPRCATQNLDDAKFCRACGADVRLVPQALAGLMPAGLAKEEGAGKIEKKRKKDEKDPRLLEKGMENIFVGVAFLVIFLAGLLWFRGAFMIWIWFIIPALACAGEGLG